MGRAGDREKQVDGIASCEGPEEAHCASEVVRGWRPGCRAGEGKSGQGESVQVGVPC